MARALATAPHLLLLDEIAGGLTEGECLELVETIRDIRATGMTILWIEHVVHALLAVIDRLSVLNFGRKVAEGAPQRCCFRRGATILHGFTGVSLPLLETRSLTAFYGDFQVLYGIDTTIAPAETIAIIGANGAGKSSYLKAITGLIRAEPGSVRFEDRPIGALGAANILKLGIAMVPEGRRLFSSLTVEENLLIGRYGRDVDGIWSLDTIYALFPALKQRRTVPSHSLSGGEQQMAAIGRALMSNPRVLLCDEISLGLAPIVIRDIYDAMPRIKRNGTSIVLVEQDIGQAMKVADRVYCFQEGRVSLSGRPAELTNDQIHLAYFGR